MPPRGVKSSKRARQYEHIKESAKKQGRSTARAKQIAAATVNKQRRQAGETKSSNGGRTSSDGSRKSSAKKSGARKSGSKKSSTRSRTTSGSRTRKSAAKKR